MDYNAVKDTLKKDLDRVISLIEASLASDIDLLDRTNKSILSHSGKQLRPVLSLVSDEVREEQKAGDIEHPYTHSVTYETEEHDDLTVSEAYNYLKTLPAFEGAEDC